MSGSLLWQAHYDTTIQNAEQSGFVQLDSQRYRTLDRDDYDRAIQHPPASSIPVVDGPSPIGRSLQLELDKFGRRLELLPPAPQREAAEGDSRFFRFDVLFDPSFPLKKTSGWGPIISQIHQHSDLSSPPIEIQARLEHLWFSGGNNDDNPPRCEGLPLVRVQDNELYKVVVGVSFASKPATSIVEVWINDDEKFRGSVPWDTISPAATASFWKGASYYTGPANGGRMFQANHRIGTAREVVS